MDHRGRGHRASPLGAVPSGCGAVGVAVAGTASGRWRIEHRAGPASDLHARPWEPDVGQPSAWVLDVTEPALVLGSTQPAGVVDDAAAHDAGTAVVRRRSGGGAVLLRPGGAVWVDVLVPAEDPLWEPDVSRAFHWLGEAWCEALAGLGVDAGWHDGGLVPDPWSRLVCFAGLGPGEVAVGGRKVVGISQRRRRSGALFQCAALLEWDPGRLLNLLRLPDGEREGVARSLASVAAGLDVDGGRLAGALLDRLVAR